MVFEKNGGSYLTLRGLFSQSQDTHVLPVLTLLLVRWIVSWYKKKTNQ